MKQVKLHLPKKLENMFAEARPELTEDDTFFSLKKKGNRGQTQTCPHYSKCIIEPKRKVICEDYKNKGCYRHYERYGEDWNEYFI